jgi:hypothetical protein
LEKVLKRMKPTDLIDGWGKVIGLGHTRSNGCFVVDVGGRCVEVSGDKGEMQQPLNLEMLHPLVVLSQAI